jgi:uncharacterized protein YkwD
MSRVAALVGSLALLAATGTTSVAIASPATHAVDVRKPSPSVKYAQQAFAATNANRAQSGLKELRSSDCLRTFAVRQARLMAQREQIFHQDLGAALQACKLTAAAENVASGYPSGRSVVNDGWMNSDGHRANILDPSYRLMAIGARKGHNGRWYVAQVFGRKG